jgi:8-oxo-dGTP diphosphatase
VNQPRSRVWGGEGWVEVPVAGMQGEALVVPNIAAIVLRDQSASHLLLQRRDKPDVVRGLLEIPTGRWRAGEAPGEALRREVGEETGLEVRSIVGEGRRYQVHPDWPVWAMEPAAVVVGAGGAYPALLVAFVCVADGEPRPRPGETADPRWYPVDEVRRLLRDSPRALTAVAHAVLAAWLGV